jgi:hypothetical protein
MEDAMTALKSLAFTALAKRGHDPVLNRRAKVIARLEEQKQLLADPNFIRLTQKWTRKEGERAPYEKKQRVSPWWRLTETGAYVFVVRSGGKAIEFEKGKTAIAVPSKDKLPAVIDTLIAAVRGGELDAQLAQASREKQPPKRKAA